MGVLDGSVTARAASDAALAEEKYQIQENGLVQGYHDLLLAKTNGKIGAARIFLAMMKMKADME